MWMTSHPLGFWAKAADVCGLYLNPPENAIVWSVDEKSGIQARNRLNPTKPAVPGIPTRREFEYRRHGTAVLFAGLEVHAGDVAAGVTDSTRSDNLVAFLTDLDDQTPPGLELHCIIDDLSAHFTPTVEELLEQRPHIFLHTTPDPRLVAESGRAVLLDPRASTPAQRRLRLRRGPRRPRHHLHQRLQPPRATVPLDRDGRPLRVA
jgi:hypothetical protein